MSPLAKKIAGCLARGMSPEEVEARHGEVAGMYARYQLDPRATLRSIGAAWGGITAERVRQRFRAAGLRSRTLQEMAVLRREVRLAGVRGDAAREAAVRDAWVEGVATNEIARRLELQPSDVKQLVGELVTASDEARRQDALARRRSAARVAMWATAPSPELLEEFTDCVRRAWRAQGRPEDFTGGLYDQAARRDCTLPSLSTLIIHYRWADLLDRARLQSRRATRRSGYKRTSPAECWAALRLAAAELDAPNVAPPRGIYLRHSTGRSDMPCAATVERRLGGWALIQAQWPGPPDEGDGDGDRDGEPAPLAA